MCIPLDVLTLYSLHFQSLPSLLAFRSLLHLELEQAGLRAAWGLRVLSSLLVECIAAFVQSIYLGLAPLLLIRVFGQTSLGLSVLLSLA